jgi:glycosyltransferase involved in cell wall biosynthesis
MSSDSTWVLQFCHGYSGQFLDCARQYASLFAGTPFKVTTVYLTGEPSVEAERSSAADEVIFLNFSSKEVRSLKLKAIRELKRVSSRHDYALVIAHRFKPVYIALLATRLPVIGVHHAFADYRRLHRRIFANLFRRRLTLLGVSNAVRDDIRSSLPSWPAEKIETLYNRVDIDSLQAEQLDREASRQALGLPLNAWVVGNAGRLHPDKDHATLIRAFAGALPGLPGDSLLAIMGSGKLEASLKELAAELGVAGNVCFLGQVPNGRRYFKAFDLFALTSDCEPFGMVLLEAMAAGVPVICSDCGGGREVVAGVGGLFPLRDCEALSRLLITRANTPAVAETALREILTGHFRAHFCDEAVRRKFWELPAVAPFVKAAWGSR